MLNRYFIKPRTLDRIRASWLAEPIESYVEWLAEHAYAPSTVRRRVPMLMHFAEFTRDNGARAWPELPGFVEGFVDNWVQSRCDGRTERARRDALKSARVPVEQMVDLLVPGALCRRSRPRPLPFIETAPRFFDHLREERGLREASIELYGHNLRRFEAYLARPGQPDVSALSPSVLSAFIIDSANALGKGAIGSLCSHVRVFLGYLYRDGLLPRDLSESVDRPRMYRLSSVPRSISWDELQQVLQTIDRGTPTGKRDFAIMLLLATYGLRAREVAGLTLRSIDWRSERLHVPERKAGHSSVFPLSPVVGEAIVDYLRNARPENSERALFLRSLPPFRPVSFALVSDRSGYWLRRAGIQVRRAGSHTLRHSCVRRLVEARFPFKVIGDYIGHRDPNSTAIYTKIDLDALREVALSGCGEDVL